MLQWVSAGAQIEGAVRPKCVGETVQVPRDAAGAALVEALNATLLRHRSATAALERWCRARGAGPEATVRALRLPAVWTPALAQRRRLAVGPAEAIRHRRVRLTCAGRTLSEADNWYVPGRLTLTANRLLESGDTPFGRAVGDLPFRRRVLAVERLWAPTAKAPPSWILRHHALLIGPDGAPISEVVETYARDALFLGENR